MQINHVIKTMVLSDFYIESGIILFGPIFAIFVTQQIDGGTIKVVGFAAALTQIFKIGLQVPIARYLDKNHGEYDDFYSMFIGSMLISAVPFLYLFASTINHIYMIAAVMGVGIAFFAPPRMAIFSRHLDKEHENIEWSFKSISIGGGAAGAAALGGIIADKFGFNPVFIIAGIITFIGALIELKLFKDLKEKVPQGTVRPSDGKF